MNLDKSSKWFDSIKPPENKMPGGGAGYLDRMMGTSEQVQRQFLTNPRSQIQKSKPKINSQASKPKQNPAIKTKITNPAIDVEDANWIADRKKRFPKTTADLANDKCDTIAAAVKTTAIPQDTPKENPISQQPSSTAKPNNKGPQAPNNNRRKKTLFEKLMEMDQ